MKMYDKGFMQAALDEAQSAGIEGEVPVGAVLVVNDEIIARAHNSPIKAHDPCAHAEILVLREAGKVLQNYRLTSASLYVTLEPCAMCVAAMIHARIERCVYGAPDPKTGACGSVIDLQALHNWNHRVLIEGGVLGDESAHILKTFFQLRRC